jgi:gephyrin
LISLKFNSNSPQIFIDDDILKRPAEKPMSITSDSESDLQSPRRKHVCPHKTAAAGDKDDRNSPFPMLDVDVALEKIFATVKQLSQPEEVRSPMNLPPFRASIKDGYAVKSASTAKKRTVQGFISAGDPIEVSDFPPNACFKINTGAAVPKFADAVIQIEDTKLLKTDENGQEVEIEVLEIPKAGQDIRDVGCDLTEGELMFKTNGLMGVAEQSILASVGLSMTQKMPRIAVISTGDELVDPSSGQLQEGQIYDSNSTMLKLLLQKFGFEVKMMAIAKDDYDSLKAIVVKAMQECDVIISSGGVSMGDKDFVKPLMKELGFEIQFGRVNMKPGKPMTFASNGDVSYFALPGNPVSAFVTFHLFVLPALRFMCGFPVAKCKLPVISAILQLDKYTLDSRPEFARARIAYSTKKGLYYAYMPENQMSSRLGSLINADVLLHLPGGTDKVKLVNRGFKLKATVINQHFISAYKD